MALSKAKQADLAMMAAFVFGCTCGDVRSQLDALETVYKKYPTIWHGIARSWSVDHFRRCVYDPWKQSKEAK